MPGTKKYTRQELQTFVDEQRDTIESLTAQLEQAEKTLREEEERSEVYYGERKEIVKQFDKAKEELDKEKEAHGQTKKLLAGARLIAIARDPHTSDEEMANAAIQTLMQTIG